MAMRAPDAGPQVIWSAAFPGGGRQVIAWSPKDGAVASGGEDGLIRLLDAASGSELRALRHRGSVDCIAFSPDGRRLAAAGGVRVLVGNEGEVRIFDPGTGTLLRTIRAGDRAVPSIAWSPDGSRLAAGGDDGSARVFEAETGAPLGQPLTIDGSVTALGFSRDGACLAAGSDSMVRCFNLFDGAVLLERRVASGPLSWIGLSAEGREVVAASSASVQRWDFETGKAGVEFTVPGQTFGGVVADASDDGRPLAVGQYDGVVSLSSPRAGRECDRLRGPAAPV